MRIVATAIKDRIIVKAVVVAEDPGCSYVYNFSLY